MKTSDTPRTDAFLKALDQRSPYSSHKDYLDLKEFARNLEREVSAAMSFADNMKQFADHSYGGCDPLPPSSSKIK